MKHRTVDSIKVGDWFRRMGGENDGEVVRVSRIEGKDYFAWSEGPINGCALRIRACYERIEGADDVRAEVEREIVAKLRERAIEHSNEGTRLQLAYARVNNMQPCSVEFAKASALEEAADIIESGKYGRGSDGI